MNPHNFFFFFTVIGGWENSQSVIRRQSQHSELARVFKSNVLFTDRPILIIVEISIGKQKHTLLRRLHLRPQTIIRRNIYISQTVTLKSSPETRRNHWPNTATNRRCQLNILASRPGPIHAIHISTIAPRLKVIRYWQCKQTLQNFAYHVKNSHFIGRSISMRTISFILLFPQSKKRLLAATSERLWLWKIDKDVWHSRHSAEGIFGTSSTLCVGCAWCPHSLIRNRIPKFVKRFGVWNW